MSKIFKYSRIVGEYHIGESDEYETEEFIYEVNDEDLLDEVVNILYKQYFKGDKAQPEKIKFEIRQLIKDNELLETFVENYEEDLKDIFEYEALGLC